MKLFAIMVCCLAVANAMEFTSELEEKWEDYKQKYNKSYDETEHEFRFKIFGQNLRKISNHNKKFEAGKSTYKMGINRFTDLLHSEFVENILMKPKEVELQATHSKTATNVDVPDSFDWRSEGAVTGIKDQGSCGSCWAFSTVGTIEGNHFIKSGELVSLSEQNVLDCGWSPINKACDGGEIYEALKYVVKNGGIDTEESYPYTAESSHDCKYDEASSGASITGYKKVSGGDEDNLKNAVAKFGPVSIGMDVEDSFWSYESGVYYEESCEPTFLNHAVLAVGYGTDEESGKDYWIVKNSWGTEWGEDGYVRMARNEDNNCGVATECYYPTV